MPLERPFLCLFALLIMALMVLLFLFGDFLPTKIVPPAVAIIAATLALLLIYEAKVEPVTKVLQDVDWRTILFIICLFCLVEAFTKTGILQGMSQFLYAWFGTDLILISLAILVGVAFCSSLLANIPVVAAMLLMVKGYLVTAQLVPEQALAATFAAWPPHILPCFCGHDVCRDPGRECHPHRRFGQCGGRRYLRLSRQAGVIRDFYALWRAPDYLPVGRLRAVCAGHVLRRRSVARKTVTSNC